jgi:AraC-like DNA-binding protein
MVSYWDREKILRYASIRFLNRFNLLDKNPIGTLSIAELLGPLYEEHLSYIKSVMNGKPKVFEQDLMFETPDVFRCIFTYYPDKKDGILNGFYLQILEKPQLNLLDPDLMNAINGFNNILVEASDSVINEEVTSEEDGINPQIKKVADYLETILLTGFPGLALIAEIHYMSVSKLKRDFKLAYGMSPFLYYRKLQMDIAEQFIRKKEYRIGELAIMFNFSNPYNFTACYRRFKSNSVVMKLSFIFLIYLFTFLFDATKWLYSICFLSLSS